MASAGRVQSGSRPELHRQILLTTRTEQGETVPEHTLQIQFHHLILPLPGKPEQLTGQVARLFRDCLVTFSRWPVTSGFSGG